MSKYFRDDATAGLDIGEPPSANPYKGGTTSDLLWRRLQEHLMIIYQLRATIETAQKEITRNLGIVVDVRESLAVLDKAMDHAREENSQ